MPKKLDEDFVQEGAQEITEKDIDKVIVRSDEIKRKFNTRGPLGRFVQDARLLLALVKDYRSGVYRRTPFATIAAIAFSLIYVFNPFDLMPDVLPIIGQIDDVAVISACLLLIEQDLGKYRSWIETKSLSVNNQK